MTEHEPAPPETQRRLTLTGWALLAFAGVLVAALFISGWEDAVAAVSRVGIWGFAGLCALAAAHYAIRVIRWIVLVRVAGLTLPFAEVSLQFLAGFAMTATPGRVGELVRLRWLMRSTGRGFGHLLPIAFADRAIELAAMLAVIVLALAAAGLGSVAAWWLTGVGILLTLVVCRPGVLKQGVDLLHLLSGRRRPRLFVKLRRLTRRLGPFMRPGIFIPLLLIGMVGWALEGVAFWLALDWIGASIALPAAMAIFLVAVLSGALSGLPGGLGGTEATAVGLLALIGVPLDMAIFATAVIRVATLWFAVAIGFTALPLVEARHVRAAS